MNSFPQFNKIKFLDFWIGLRGDKILIGSKTLLPESTHFTLHLGGDSNKIDIHIKDEKTNSYLTVIEINKNEIEEIMKVILHKLQSAFFNISEIKTTNEIINEIDYFVVMEKENENEEEMNNYFNSRIRKKELVLKEEDFSEDKLLNDRGVLANIFRRIKKATKLKNMNPKIAVGIKNNERVYAFFKMDDDKYMTFNEKKLFELQENLLDTVLGSELKEKIYNKFKKAISLIDLQNQLEKFYPLKITLKKKRT